jgi:hypothetical protein
MILSRFWYVILAGAAVAGLLASLAVTNLVNDLKRDRVVDDLARDRLEIEATLKLDARARLDAIAAFAANSDVRQALRAASGRQAGQPIPPELTTRLRTTITTLNDQLAGLEGDLVFAVDAQGWIVAAVAPGNIPDGAGIGHFPLVRRALDGYVRDDVWVYNGGVYRMAARPVIDGGQYVGALIHGKRFDDQLAERLSQTLGGATVAFFNGSEMYASYMPEGAPRREDAAGPLGGVIANEAFQRGERLEPAELPTGGLAVYSLVTGTSREDNVGYSIARPLEQYGAPWELVLAIPGSSWMELLQVWWIWAPVFLFAILFAMFCLWLERDRPLGKLQKAASALPGSPENRLTVTDFGGKHRRIAQSVNDALDKAVEAAGAASPKRKAANLDEILGPSADAPSQPAFYGFSGSSGGPGGDAMMMPDVPPAVPSPRTTPMGPMGGPIGGGPVAPTAPLGGPPLGGPSLGGPSLGGPSLGAPPPPAPKVPPIGGKPPIPPMGAKPPLPPPGAKPAAMAPAKPAEEPAGAASEGESDQTMNAKAGRKQLKRTLLGVPPPADDDEEDEGATMVAKVPDELLAQSSQSIRAQPDDEDAHFREVFEKFLETKKQCGEPTAGLTYEKFLVTLRKNRDQIVSRHGARKVRFTVYVKAGKAALKATPIRE